MSALQHPLSGIYAAAVTPMDAQGQPLPTQLPPLLDFLRGRGVHGVLLLGTTGEGPSHSPEERLALMQAAAAYRQAHPDLRILVGTGTPSLDETARLTRAAFDLGFDGVVVLPPYYFRGASEEGLERWFAALMRQAVPEDGALFAYHIPSVAGIGFSLDLLARLKEAFPRRFVGLKDSSGDPHWAVALGERFGADLLVFTGNDRLLSHALTHGAGGAITALANLASPWLREVWEAFRRGDPQRAQAPQARLDAAREALEQFPPYGPTVKAMLAARFGLPSWGVKPPLLSLSGPRAEAALATLGAALEG